MNAGPRRRDVLRWGALGLVAGCARPPWRPVDHAEPMVAAFEPRPDGALLWVYSTRPVALGLHAARDAAPRQTWTLRPSADRGHTAVVPLTGLAADTPWHYRLDDGPWHTFRTAPAPDADAPAFVAVVVDLHPWGRFHSPILDTVRHSPATSLVSLGDWPYADARPEAKTLADYRWHHRVARLQPDVRRLAQRLPMYGTWDDHELANDWDAGWRAEHPEQTRAGVRAWDEFWPVSPALPPAVRYRKWRWGAHLECFLLDTRSWRSAVGDPDGPSKTMLGVAQREWLFAGLAASAATFKVVFASVPLDFGTTPEHFNAWRHERGLLEAAVAATPGAIVVSGDQHWFAAHRHASGVREYQFGPTQMLVREPPPADPAVFARIAEPNFGEIQVEPGAHPRLHVRARGVHGALLFSEVVSAPPRG